jgi:hypothetical protein
MPNRAGLLRILGSLLASCSLLCAGCTALIAYIGQDVGKLANKTQVHESFGTPTNLGNEGGYAFEEYRTRRRISEPEVADLFFKYDAMTLGLFELVVFPAAICQTTWSTLVGRTLRFEYAENGDVLEVLIDGGSMKARAQPHPRSARVSDPAASREPQYIDLTHIDLTRTQSLPGYAAAPR